MTLRLPNEPLFIGILMTNLHSQVTSIVNASIDRIHILVEKDRIDDAKSLYIEYLEWLDANVTEHDVLSFSIEK